MPTTLATSDRDQLGAFAYAFTAEAKDDCVIICIDLVVPMRWVDSPKCFCAILETLIDVANALVHKSLPVPAYRSTSPILETDPGPLYTLDSLTYIDCYTDDLITLVQRGPD